MDIFAPIRKCEFGKRDARQTSYTHKQTNKHKAQCTNVCGSVKRKDINRRKKEESNEIFSLMEYRSIAKK